MSLKQTGRNAPRKGSAKLLRDKITPHPEDYTDRPYLTFVRYYLGAHSIGLAWTVKWDEKSKNIEPIKFINLTNIKDDSILLALDGWDRSIPPDIYLATKGFNLEGMITQLYMVSNAASNGTGSKRFKVVKLEGTIFDFEYPPIVIKTRRRVSQRVYLNKMKNTHKPQVLPNSNTTIHKF